MNPPSPIPPFNRPILLNPGALYKGAPLYFTGAEVGRLEPEVAGTLKFDDQQTPLLQPGEKPLPAPGGTIIAGYRVKEEIGGGGFGWRSHAEEPVRLHADGADCLWRYTRPWNLHLTWDTMS